MRGKVGLILVKIIFNCFNFYSIDREIRGKDGALDDRLVFSMAIWQVQSSSCRRRICPRMVRLQMGSSKQKNSKCTKEKITKNIIGDAGYRSPYLSHAKRALYHLSYIPERVARLWSTSCRQAKEMRSIQDRGVAGTRGFHRKSNPFVKPSWIILGSLLTC